MGAMTCRTCGMAAITASKETVKDSSGKITGIRFTMKFPCDHFPDKYRIRKMPDGRRNVQRF